MKVLFFSDIHTEMGGISTPWLDRGPNLVDHKGNTDLVILAGDIGKGTGAFNYATAVGQYLGCPVILVPGNHEYYDRNFDEMRDSFKLMSNDRVIVLDRDEYRMDGLRVLGATLWTDYAVLGTPTHSIVVANTSLLDHRVITKDGHFWRPTDALAEHYKSREWFIEKLKESFDGQTLLVSHHVPHSTARHPRFGMSHMSPAFVSDCNDVILAAMTNGKVAGWIFGHDHWNYNLLVGGIHLMSAQMGYPGEKNNWSGPGILEIDNGQGKEETAQ